MTKEEILDKRPAYNQPYFATMISVADAADCMQEYADQECKQKDAEIERLKGLLETLFKDKHYDYLIKNKMDSTNESIHKLLEKAWYEYQEQNKL